MSNRDIEVLREVVVKVTKLLAGQSIEVTQRGAQAYARANKSGKPYLVNIPYIPDGSSPGFLAAIQGFIDHEVGHILFTDWSVQRTINGNKKLHSCWNIVEDPFVERMMSKKFPGTAYNLDKVYGYFLEHITIPALGKAENEFQEFGVLLVPLIRALSGQSVFDRWLKAEGHYEHPLIKALLAGMKPDSLASLPTLKTSRECLAVARELYAVMNPPKPVAPPAAPPSEEKSEDTEPKGKGEGEPEKEKETPAPKAPPAEEPKDGEDGEDDAGPAAPFDDPTAPEGGPEPVPEEPEAEDEAPAKDEPEAEDEEPGKGASADEDEERTPEDDEVVGGGESEDEAEEEPAEDPEDKAGGEEPAADPEGDEESELEDEHFDGEDAGAGGSGEGEDGEGEDDGSEAGGEDEGDGEGGEETEKPGAGCTSPFEDGEDPEIEKQDFEKALADHLTELSSAAASTEPYVIYTKDFDKVATYEPTSDYDDAWLVKLDEQVGRMIGVMSKDIERMMAAKSRVQQVPGFRSGRLHAGNLHRLTTGDDRVFRRKHESKSKETDVTLLIDCSGSMSGSKMETAMMAGYALSLTLERVGIRHEVIGFTTLHNRHSAASKEEAARIGRKWTRTEPIYMPVFKGFDERLSSNVKKRFADACYGQEFLRNNIDGECIEIAANRLLQQRGERKVLIVLSDGMPACETFDARAIYAHCAAAVKRTAAKGVETIGVGIMSRSVEAFYPKHVVLDRIADLPGVVMGHLRAVLQAA